MLGKGLRYLKSLRSMQRVNMALARGAATSPLRALDMRDPLSWEFSAFSQNGEDGIIDVLTRHVLEPNRYFIEIGAADGLENNTAWLALARRFSGMWVEGDRATSDWARYLFTSLNYGIECLPMFVTKERSVALSERVLHREPDVLSVDIDGNDYHVVEAMLSAGLRPRIAVVEFNSAFGPHNCVTIPYSDDFRCGRARGENLYYGSSIGAWKRLFARVGYAFVTVDLNGTNAFFIEPHAFDAGFVDGIRGLDFAENFAQLTEYRTGWQGQQALIRGKSLTTIE